MEFRHTSVLLRETIENLKIKDTGTYVDGTLGGGGHSLEIIKRLKKGGRLIGVDQDDAAIEAAGKRLAPWKEAPDAGQITIVRSNYRFLPEILRELGIGKADGILLDLGVSSYQLDMAERGFSYREEDAALDMRMDRRQELTARDIVNDWSEHELYRIIRDYGEDRFAGNIAKHIALARQEKPIETSGQLNEIIRAAIPARVRATGGHPSKRTYQAIRIACNGELEALGDSLDMLIDLLKPEGRLCIITFHSLEDRLVKTAFKRNENPCVCPPDFPVCVCGRESKGRAVTKKPILPDAEEQKENKRAKSAKLRVFERI